MIYNLIGSSKSNANVYSAARKHFQQGDMQASPVYVRTRFPYVRGLLLGHHGGLQFQNGWPNPSIIRPRMISWPSFRYKWAQITTCHTEIAVAHRAAEFTHPPTGHCMDDQTDKARCVANLPLACCWRQPRSSAHQESMVAMSSSSEAGA